LGARNSCFIENLSFHSSEIALKNEQIPTISVCIPVYNVDVRKLAHSLINQLDATVELIFIDDCSQQHYKELNAELKSKQLTWINLEQNVGRSKIRNLFLKYTQHDYLLFIDCDSHIVTPNFLKNYQKHINANSQVMFGGQLFPAICPSKEQRLSWTCGMKSEMQNATKRNKHPNHSIKTNNLLIKRTTLAQLPFEERINDYGHEDTLYGIECQRHGIIVQHIDNPVLNAHIDNNSEYLQKIETAISTLIKIGEFYQYNQLLNESVRLLAFARKIEVLHMQFILRIVYKLIGKTTRRLLINTNFSSVKLLNVYKILYYFGHDKNRV